MSLQCHNRHSELSLSGTCPDIVGYGRFRRKSDGVWVKRYRCKGCGRTFSQATGTPCAYQKKRQHNLMIMQLLVGGFSQRRSAIVLVLNRKTIVRKFLFMGRWATAFIPYLNTHHAKVKVMEFDDLETIVHTKLKPLSLILAVEFKTRRILGFRVAQMPAKGKLAALSRKKYGFRKDFRALKREELFLELKDIVEPSATIKSDKSPHYPASVKKHFPQAQHFTTRGGRGCVSGQGELKKLKNDPIFTINHTFAMLRANINRLFRKTWCTTKVAERLEYHVGLYALYHNLKLIKKRSGKKQVPPEYERIAALLSA